MLTALLIELALTPLFGFETDAENAQLDPQHLEPSVPFEESARANGCTRPSCQGSSYEDSLLGANGDRRVATNWYRRRPKLDIASRCACQIRSILSE